MSSFTGYFWTLPNRAQSVNRLKDFGEAINKATSSLNLSVKFEIKWEENRARLIFSGVDSVIEDEFDDEVTVLLTKSNLDNRPVFVYLWWFSEEDYGFCVKGIWETVEILRKSQQENN